MAEIDYKNLRYVGSPYYQEETIPGERPTLPAFAPIKYPSYTVPERRPERVEELTQQLAAPGVRGLRTQVQRAIGRRYVNPQVARMTLREALAGYGAGLESVMGGARTTALGQYETEYAPQAEKARLEYQTGISRAQSEWEARRAAQMTEYQAAMEEYLESPERKMPTKPLSYKLPKTTFAY